MQKFDINRLDFEKLVSRIKLLNDRRLADGSAHRKILNHILDYKDEYTENLVSKHFILTINDIENCIKRTNRRKFIRPSWPEVISTIDWLIEMGVLETSNNFAIYKLVAHE